MISNFFLPIYEIDPNNEKDVKQLVDLRNNFNNTTQFLKDPNCYNYTQTKDWLLNLPATSKRLVIKTADNELLGIFRIDNIDSRNQSCCIGLDIQPIFRGKGWACKIYKEVINYLFFHYNMHSLYLEVLDTNEKACHIYEKLGFKEVGRKREAIWRGGRWCDYIIMDILASEWNNKE